MIEEKWAKIHIDGYGDLTVNNLGTVVKSKDGVPLVLKQTGNTEYLRCRIQIIENGVIKRKRLLVHRLVALAFVPNPDNLPQVNHKDGDKLNNVYTNLEWCSAQDNIQHAFENRLNEGHLGENNGQHVLTEEEVIEIRKRYTGAKGEQLALGREFGVSNITIFDIVHNKTWTYLLDIE